MKRHIMRDYPIGHIMPYVNMQMLLGHHLGLERQSGAALEEKDAKALELKDTVDSILNDAQKKGIIQAHGMYRFFPAQSNGNDVIVYDPEDHYKALHTFTFPRQETEPYYCLADYLKSVDSGEMDYVASCSSLLDMASMSLPRSGGTKGIISSRMHCKLLRLKLQKALRSEFIISCVMFGESQMPSNDDAGAFWREIYRPAFLLRLSGLSESGGSSAALRFAEAGGYRCRTDGSRS